MRVQPRIAAQQYGGKNEFCKLVANIKIYFTILIYFYHNIVALRCVAASTCFNWIPSCAKQAAWDQTKPSPL